MMLELSCGGIAGNDALGRRKESPRLAALAREISGCEYDCAGVHG